VLNLYVHCVCRTIGVVGIDSTLEEIENVLLNDQWGSVYAFLINEEGETIFHPLLRPSTEVLYLCSPGINY